jgi:hypothetical protein
MYCVAISGDAVHHDSKPYFSAVTSITDGGCGCDDRHNNGDFLGRTADLGPNFCGCATKLAPVAALEPGI